MRVTLGLFSLPILGMLSFPALAGSDATWYSRDDSDFLEFQLGAFDLLPKNTFAYGLEYHSDIKIFDYVKPIVGILSTAQGAVYGYGGFAVDFYLERHIVLTPSLAVGVYGHGNDANLGTAFPEFRSAIEIAYRFDDDSRLGVEFHHISNAGSSGKNPGAETLLLTYAYPLQKLRNNLFGESPGATEGGHEPAP